MAFILRIKLENKNYSRITFNEITKTAVKDSIKHARDIDMNLSRCTAGKTCSGPNRRIPDQSDPLGKDQTRVKCWTSSVRSPTPDL